MTTRLTPSPEQPCPMSRGDFYAAIRLLEVFAPADPLVTNVQVVLGKLCDFHHPGTNKISPELFADVTRVEKMNTSALAEAVRAERARWAAFADENGEPRKVLGTLPVTKDGAIIGQGANLWYVLPKGSATEIVSMKHSAYMEAYQPSYSSKEAAQAALAAAKEAKWRFAIRGSGNGG